jgi:hypothetical protein
MSQSQRGEGRLSSIIWLVVFAALGWAAWNVAPAYIANFSLTDKMNEIARTPRGPKAEQQVQDQLAKYIRQERLDEWIDVSMFQVSTVETNRRITLEYEREVQILPGFKKVLHFTDKVEQPLLY